LLHCLTAATLIVPALMIAYVLEQHHLPWIRATKVSCLLALILAAGMAITLLRTKGLRLLRFVTLIPVVLSVAALLRIGAPTLDATLSARPLMSDIGRLEDVNALPPLAVFGVPREAEYGLAFYRNQVIVRYEAGQIPSGTHIVVTPQSARSVVGKVLQGRRISYLGTFWPQKVDYFWVASAGGD
jgi:hypothetical protein